MPDANVTKMTLANSLKKLMAEKDFSKINVADIVRGCGLARQSFYYHFKDKYDLMNWIYYTETARIITTDDVFASWTDGLRDLCCYMQQNKTFYRNALNTSGQNSFPEYLHGYIRSISISAIEGAVDIEAEYDKWEFITSFFATAFVAFIVRWANSDMKEDPSEFLEKMRNVFDGSIQNELENRRQKEKSYTS
ncbi:transcriptional regulator, TetR family [Sporobacter termitidis DSM 10068]|uniref:Transcriptional regulator, TetR family n=1 Tax=Sporobacter termitidis DSM 10068 TaxID=1123282 RepID=A0A1M5WJL1_9FIRM|nr:dihydroxyacetone kinase transcriptional activator DhaS [Sporobacter termitidis]SHH87749.1 transcriptional regulator, TetR family [Sporobacter termitidis DSM 10068]